MHLVSSLHPDPAGGASSALTSLAGTNTATNSTSSSDYVAYSKAGTATAAGISVLACTLVLLIFWRPLGQRQLNRLVRMQLLIDIAWSSADIIFTFTTKCGAVLNAVLFTMVC